MEHRSPSSTCSNIEVIKTTIDFHFDTRQNNSPPEVHRVTFPEVPFTFQPLINNQLQDDMAENINILQALETIQEAITGIEEQRQNPTSQALKLKHFHGYPSEDVEDWITKFKF